MNGCIDRWTSTTYYSLGSEHLEGSAGCTQPPSQEYTLASDGLTFPTDINECVTDLHTCSRGEHCVNTVGSFRCYKALTCQPGYILEDGECTGEHSGLQVPPLICPAPPPALSHLPMYPWLAQSQELSAFGFLVCGRTPKMMVFGAEGVFEATREG